MENDPLLLGLTALSLVIDFLLTYWLSRFKMKYVWFVSLSFLVVGFVLFLFLVIMQSTTIGLIVFDISISLWTGGFFGIFYALYLNSKHKKKG